MFSNDRCSGGNIFLYFFKKIVAETKYIVRGITIESALPLTLAVVTLFATIILWLFF